MGIGAEPRIGRFEIDLHMKVRIVESLCIACGLCHEVCPERAVHPKMQDIHHMYEVLEHECTGCGDCLAYCPAPGALEEYKLAAR